MKTVLVIVGAAGAGKSTLMRALETARIVRVLKPSTTRPRRGPEDDEYSFVDSEANWFQRNWAWQIKIRNRHWYGLEDDALSNLGNCEVGATVFYPGEIDTLQQFRKTSDVELVTVGLDTIEDHSEQLQRVGGNADRHEGPDAFGRHVAAVRECDVVLKGSEEDVFNACKAVVECLENRGILGRRAIEALIKAGTLLRNASNEQINEASYDLRLSPTVWSQGRHVAAERNSVIIVPAYSYTVVEALEIAHLPAFIVARYDLRLSLFLRGIILSNGPQVDPGYGGGLLCTLFNASDTDYPIKPEEHFATVEFAVLNRTTGHYKGRHQNQSGVSAFMDAHVLTSSGGTINDKMKQLVTDWKAWRIGLLKLAVTIFTIIFGVYQWCAAKIDELKEMQRTVSSLIETAKRESNPGDEKKVLNAKEPTGRDSPTTQPAALPAAVQQGAAQQNGR